MACWFHQRPDTLTSVHNANFAEESKHDAGKLSTVLCLDVAQFFAPEKSCSNTSRCSQLQIRCVHLSREERVHAI